MGGMRRRLAALLTARLAASLAPPSPPTNQLVPSPLVFGTLRLHEAPQPFQLLTKAWDLGIAAFDTAADVASRLILAVRDPATLSYASAGGTCDLAADERATEAA